MMKAAKIFLTLAVTLVGPQALASSGTIAVTIEGMPTPAELTAIKRTLTKDELDELPVLVGHADLNGDHRPDLIFRSNNSEYCGSTGCDTEAILATPKGFASQSIGLAYSFGKVLILSGAHKGMHDLRYEGGSKTFIWNGKEYQ